MSLIIALSKSNKAVIGGDKRSITFLGSCALLEQELYSGNIQTDQDLLKRLGSSGRRCRWQMNERRFGGKGTFWWEK